MLETASDLPIAKFERHHKRPWFLSGRVNRLPGIVCGDPFNDVGRETHIVSFCIHGASEDVDECLFFRNHSLLDSKNESNGSRLEKRQCIG